MITRSMKLMKAFINGIFRSKLFIMPCIKLNKPVLIRSLALCRPLGRRSNRHKLFLFFFNPSKTMFSPSPSFFSVFRSPKRSSPKHAKNKLECDDDHGVGPSIDAPEVEAVVFPSPSLTVSPDASGYNDNNRRESDVQRMSEGGGDVEFEVEEACRRFERHLVEMIVEEGKTKDLMDVEELLRCWKKLKCPVFVDLVCRFYGELCKDLFSSQTIHDNTS